jgi:hypothetical protein
LICDSEFRDRRSHSAAEPQLQRAVSAYWRVGVSANAEIVGKAARFASSSEAAPQTSAKRDALPIMTLAIQETVHWLLESAKRGRFAYYDRFSRALIFACWRFEPPVN